MKEKIRFAFHIMAHPFDGFWDMKREKKGDFWFSILIFALAVAAQVLSKQMMAFLFNAKKYAPFDTVFEINKYLVIFAVFCVANWSITTLMQGEGTFRDIVMTTGYACLPLVIIPLPVALLSNLMTYTEEVYINAAVSIAWIWFFALLFMGIMTIHQYMPGKMLLTALITVIAMAAIIFIGVLFFNLFTQIIGFVFSIYKEISLRT